MHRTLSVWLLLVGFTSCAITSGAAWAQTTRSDIHISGIYPHLTVYGIYSQNGAHLKGGHNECGIGAVVPWANQLWMVNYAPHQPNGSEHKLYSISNDLELTIHPESVGGTPAGRMIHPESGQLLIAHYLIDRQGKVRVIPIKKMPMRVTAIARHLTDPANMVYYIDMEGAIWEANVHTLEVKRLFKKPVPGWHSKGGYTSQGRLVISNNGELHAGTYDDLVVGGPAKNQEERGVLAEYDGVDWKIIERRQYTEVTGPSGISGGSDGDDPIWTMGWDRRSVRLKVLDNGTWHTFLLPKAAMCNDAYHGWYTEWPRIREITDGRWMMDMHGMFFDFPPTFSAGNSAGIKPIASHLRYIPDFCAWNDQLVLATDETSIQGNPLAGQPQTNLWFGQFDELKSWGPASGYGGPWIADPVTADVPSDPFLVGGFDRRVLHLAIGDKRTTGTQGLRATDQQPIRRLPDTLQGLPRVTVKRGDWTRPAAGYSFDVNQPVTVFLAVDARGETELPDDWQRTTMTLVWGQDHHDIIYRRKFPAGTITIPGNDTQHSPGAFGMPHTAFVATELPALAIDPNDLASVSDLDLPSKPSATAANVSVTIEVDAHGNGNWITTETIVVPDNGYVCHTLPEDLDATWLRLKVDRDCVATAVLHQTTAQFQSPDSGRELFSGIAAADSKSVQAAKLYPAKRNRNLRVIAGDGRHYEFTKSGFEFQATEKDSQLEQLLAIEPEFSVDEASVILRHNGINLRLPKGDEAFDRPFASGWPRGSREVESERHLANFHGTFYEVPLITNGQPPAFHQMRPVASHHKQITDFCSWNGLLVLAGVDADARVGDHVFSDPDRGLGLWFGGVDDLWRFGKPVGRGGPWKDTSVAAGEPSDPYLMTGYDRKRLQLSADRDVNITLQVDVDHQSGWHDYKTFSVKAGQPLEYEFPISFSAHWVRFQTDQACTTTAQLEYR
ncbi:hypothetical protein NHH03_21545 [Stieleria sp. TO1_6]|uniref:hypothetical protein n=1 Tax=Stieleria tagensis TaxID=2956795 RepID=UPI00209B2E25|nr:hypothetical protein [Stieleria tagensis]MCO8124339.1 hypothetical protein [Stieleria tagensis]